MGGVADQCMPDRYTPEVGDKDAGLLEEEAREAERRDLARELHDTVLQPIAALVTSFDSLRQQALEPGVVEAYLGAWKELAQEALDSLRDTLAGLRPHPHAAMQLPDALARYVAPHLRGRGLRVSLESVGWPDDLPAPWTTDLYLAIREALTNVEKHAHATEVSILLKAGVKQLWIIVADNGTGFDASGADARAARAHGSGFGLGGMHERVTRLGGSLTVYSSPGHGAQVHIRCPRPGGHGQESKLVITTPGHRKAGLEHVH